MAFFLYCTLPKNETFPQPCFDKACPADVLTVATQAIWLAFRRALTYYIPSKSLVFYEKMRCEPVSCPALSCFLSAGLQGASKFIALIV